MQGMEGELVGITVKLLWKEEQNYLLVYIHLSVCYNLF